MTSPKSATSETVRWVDLPRIEDERGVLGAIESGREVPFAIRRVFYMHDVQGERGGHAHVSTQQFIVPLAGTFCIEASDGLSKRVHALDDAHRGLYVPAMTWLRLFDFSPAAVCLVLADRSFDESDYIRHWATFVAAASSTQRLPTPAA